jgi:hypothetical protein
VRLRTSLLAGAVVLALAGCGGGGDGVSRLSASEAVDLTAERTAESGSSRIAFTVDTEVSGRRFQLEGGGEFDYGERRGRLELDLGSLLGELGIADGRFETVFDQTVVYMRFPRELASRLPGGGERPWLKIDLEQAAALEGLDLGQLQQLNQDPSQVLEYLRATSEVEEVGPEDVRGVETTRYRATVDLRRVADAVPAEQRARLRESIEQLIRQLGTHELPVSVWVDGDGLLRRFQQTVTVAASGVESTTDVTMELFDFGTDVEVERPDADEVLDLAEVVKRG